ncbi:hypothetical protein FQZ97_953100 [compost metagenome]
MVFVVKHHGRQHRAEHFFLRQAVVHRHIAQQGGRSVEATGGGFVHHAALRHGGDAVGPGLVQEAAHALLLALADQRAQVQVHGRWAGAQRREALAQALQQGLVQRALHQQARAGAAGLAAVLHDGIDDEGQGGVDIGVGKHDLRALAPSSSVTGQWRSAAACWISVPTRGLPVKLMWSMPGWRASASPTSWP